jgi:putative transcriptional regulator
MADAGAESLQGRLLVATPDLRDPNFDRTVVLLLEHGGGGALGVVLNRPGGTEVAEVLPGWSASTPAPAVVFDGGPVQPTAVIALGRTREGVEPTVATPLSTGLVAVDLEADPAIATGELGVLRVFAGYAGWSPGQLEGELAAGGWFVLETEAQDPFTGDPAHLWHDVLARQRGAIALFAGCPPDPSLN